MELFLYFNMLPEFSLSFILILIIGHNAVTLEEPCKELNENARPFNLLMDAHSVLQGQAFLINIASW